MGTLSGPVGATVMPNVQGAQIWIKSINQRGGLNGHEVVGIVYDDGGDPARHSAQVKEAVERRGVVAFLLIAGVLTGRASTEYIASKRVPVLGGDSADFIYATPMHFPQATALPYFAYGLLPAIKQMSPGKKKVGILTCTEAQACDQVDKVWAERTGPEGFQLAYRGKASLAQPDFTAECLSARNSGAELMLIALDPNSIQRVAGSCARQGFRPVYATQSSLIVDRLKQDPNLNGLVGTVSTFPYFQKGTPGTDEFQQAMKAFAPSTELGTGQPWGWVSGKLLEKAGANMPEPPTSAALLEGLWSLKEETLGGLTAPLTYLRDKPAAPTLCWFNVQLRDKTWSSPDTFQSHCQPVMGS